MAIQEWPRPASAQKLHELDHGHVRVLRAEAHLVRATHVDADGRAIDCVTGSNQPVMQDLAVAHLETKPAETDLRQVTAGGWRTLGPDPFDKVDAGVCGSSDNASSSARASQSAGSRSIGARPISANVRIRPSCDGALKSFTTWKPRSS